MAELLDKNNIPSHIAVIMDGNGRWAKQKGAMRVFGHQNAIQAVQETTEGCAELGVKYLTLYAFSTENWSRPKEEVEALMSLLVSTIRKELNKLTKNNIRLQTIGDTAMLPKNCQKELFEAMEATKHHNGMTLILALSYSGKWDITQACRQIALKVSEGKINPENIDQNSIAEHLSTSGIPDPELLIRTSGEMRISNFLLWQLAYSELYISNVLWPDFRKKHLIEAIKEFQRRERRFGLISEQVKQ
jgi:undecaprenyl diphosphate synthase